MPQINSLPDLRSAGIKSPEYEEARRAHARILRKQHELENKLEDLLRRLGRLDDADQRALAERMLAGEDDVPRDAEIGVLGAEVEEFKRQRRALLERAVPLAEGKVLDTVLMHRQAWARQIEREELPVRIRELRETLPAIQQTLAPKVYRLLSALRVLEWCESASSGSYAPPQDQLTPNAVREIEALLQRLEAKLAERNGAKELEEVGA